MTGTLSKIVNNVFGKQQTLPPSLSSLLLTALKQADLAQVNALCAQGVDANLRNQENFSAVTEAMLSPSKAQAAADCLKTLIGHGFVLTRDMKLHLYGIPSLAPYAPEELQDALAVKQALKDGDADTLRGLLARGVDFDIGRDYNQEYAIITAARKGHVAVLDVLLAHGASVDTKNNGDSSTLPLHQAAMHGQRDAFVRLLNAGANADMFWSNNEGFWTVIGMARKCKADPGMVDFVQDVLDARKAPAPEIIVKEAVSIRRPITLKK